MGFFSSFRYVPKIDITSTPSWTIPKTVTPPSTPDVAVPVPIPMPRPPLAAQALSLSVPTFEPPKMPVASSPVQVQALSLSIPAMSLYEFPMFPSKHRHLAMFRGYPAVTNPDMPFRFKWVDAKSNSVLNVDPDRDIQVFLNDRSDTKSTVAGNKYDIVVPINSIVWGHTRDTSKNVSFGSTKMPQENRITRSTNVGHLFDIRNLKFGWRGEKGSVTGNVSEIGKFGSTTGDDAESFVRNFYLQIFNGYSTGYTSSDTQAQKDYKLSSWRRVKNNVKEDESPTYVVPAEDGLGNLYMIYREKDAVRFIQVASHSYTELDKQLIVTNAGLATETLHYITLVDVTVSQLGTYGGSRYNSYPGLLANTLPYYAKKDGKQVNSEKTVRGKSDFPIGLANVEQGVWKPLDMLFNDVKDTKRIVRLLIDFSYSTSDPTKLSSADIISAETVSSDIIARIKLPTSSFGYEYGEMLGYTNTDGDITTQTGYFASCWEAKKGNGKASLPVYDFLHVVIPKQTSVMFRFSAYLANGVLNVLSRFNGGKTIKYIPAVRRWKWTPILNEYIVADSNEDVPQSNTQYPLLLSKIKTPTHEYGNVPFGGLTNGTDNAEHVKVFMKPGHDVIAQWEDGYVVTDIKSSEALNESSIPIASTQTVNAGKTFRQVIFIQGNNLYAIVKTGAVSFWNRFPATQSIPISNFKINTNVIAAYSDTVDDNNIRFLHNVRMSNQAQNVMLTYENTTPNTATLGSIETRLIDSADSVKPEFWVPITFSSDVEAKKAFPYVSKWKIFEESATNVNLINVKSAVRKENRIEILLNIYDQVFAANANLTMNLYLHAVDETFTPWISYSSTVIDARPVSLGTVTFTHRGVAHTVQSWGADSGRANDIIHTTINEIGKPDAFVINTGAFVGAPGTWNANIIGCDLEYQFSNSNFIVGSFNYNKTFKIFKKGKSLLDSNMKLPENIPSKIGGVIIHGGNTDGTPRSIESQHNLASGGNKYGLKLTVHTISGRKASFTLPQVVVSDHMRMIVSPSLVNGSNPYGNVIEVDASGVGGYNDLDAPLYRGDFYIGGDRSLVYNFSFNFRCAPTHVKNEQYTMYYENSAALPVPKRIATPAIHKWWVVGIPVDKDIYGLKSSYRDDFDEAGNKISIPYYEYGRVTPDITENTGKQPFSPVYKHQHALGVSNIETHVDRLTSETLTDESVENIHNIVQQSVAGDTNYNDGVVWTSGILAPTGYFDLTNETFKTTFNEQHIVSGIIERSSYAIVLILELKSGQRQGIDLVKTNSRYQQYGISDKGAYKDVHFNY